ncbi:MAG: hypothetical protein A2284_07550 [Deltaproteobacteria bacterium RIFOXYA12_FULL_61_11]|nr:MAG: hypothetical protein A2284_07550 [Deltaproteobacteria bacterium RIFOXYA12_FULL_61_11]
MTTPESLLNRYTSPVRLHLETTHRCNLRCTHCYRAADGDCAEHDRATLVSLLERAGALGVSKITLTGGELFTRPDWKEVVDLALRVCPNVSILTNGYLVDEPTLAWLAQRKVLHGLAGWFRRGAAHGTRSLGLGFSIDGLEAHSGIRRDTSGRPTSARTLLERVRLARDYGLFTTINTTISKAEVAADLPALYKAVLEAGAHRWQVDLAFPSGRYGNGRGTLPSWTRGAFEAIAAVFYRYLEAYPQLPGLKLDLVQCFRSDALVLGLPTASWDEHPCAYNFGALVVEDGDRLRFCPSLRNTDWGAWEDPALPKQYLTPTRQIRDFAALRLADLPCRDCRYGRLFHGGCRANALGYTGRLEERDPVCCAFSPFLEQVVLPRLPAPVAALYRAGIDHALPGPSARESAPVFSTPADPTLPWNLEQGTGRSPAWQPALTGFTGA